ncbi:hypothetical protein BsWGS_11772 [Bradybaena similaris]
MAAGGASKNTTNETEKEAAPNVKEKLYSGVMYESVDDDRSKSKYHHWKQKYIGDQIRAPQPLPASKRQKLADAPSAGVLSTAFGYIISPVKYIASALTYSAAETDKPLEKPKGKYSSKPREPSPRPLDALSKQTAAVNSAITPQNVLDTPQKTSEAPVKALKTMPLSEITAANSMPSAKARGGTSSLNSKDKKTASKQKPGNNKKVHDIKKSQSQQFRGSPRVFKSYSPPRNSDALPVVSTTKLLSMNEMKIMQSTRAAFRVVSREDANANADVHPFRFVDSPALASRSNNSNVVCQLSLMMPPLRDELSFIDDPLLGYQVQNCSNSSPSNWNLTESSRGKHAFHPDFMRRSRGSALMGLPAASNVAEVLDVSCDREAIETIFSGSFLTQCTPTQLLAGHKSQPGASFLQESFSTDSADLRETLLAKDKTQRSTSPHNKSQPLKKLERDSNMIIVPTGPPLRKASPFQSPKNSSKTKTKPQKPPKAKPPAWNKRKVSKQDSGRSEPASSKSAFLSSGSKELTSRPLSLPDPSPKRTNTAPKMKEVIKMEETKKTHQPATAAVSKTTIAAATTAVSEAVLKAATSKVVPGEATPGPKTDEKSVRGTPLTATMRATQHSTLSENEDTWLLHAIRSLSPKRKDPPHNFTSETQPAPPTTPPPTTPPPQPSAPISPSPPMAPASVSISPKSVTITSAAVATTEAETSGAQGGASRTAALAMREALRFTSVVREAMKMSHSVNVLGKKQLSSVTPRTEYDQEKQDDFPKYFSVSATLHGEFP